MQAATFTEIEDAGETLSTAQDISSASAAKVNLWDTCWSADLFEISLTGGQTFSAKTVGGASFDTQLFLFDSLAKAFMERRRWLIQTIHLRKVVFTRIRQLLLSCPASTMILLVMEIFLIFRMYPSINLQTNWFWW